MNETLVKMALIDTASLARSKHIEIKVDNVDWAFKFCKNYAEMTQPFIEENIYSSATDSLNKKMAAFIGGKGVATKTEITRRFGSVAKRVREESLVTLEESGVIKKVLQDSAKSRKVTSYVRI